MPTKKRNTQPTIFKYLEPTERKCSHTEKVDFDKQLRSLECYIAETKEVKEEIHNFEYKPTKCYTPPKHNAEPKIQIAEPVRTQTEDTIIEYKNLEHMGETKVIITKTLHYDYFKIPIEWEAEDIEIKHRRLYHKGKHIINCSADNQPKDLDYPLELWVDFKVSDYSQYFQPTM